MQVEGTASSQGNMQGCSTPGGSRKNPSLPVWLPVAPGVPWFMSASLQSLSPSLYHLLLCVSVCVSCKDTCHWIRRALQAKGYKESD